MHARYSIGELAKRVGCNHETVRYYERRGIMPEPARTAGSHRVYEDRALSRLSFILRAREMGFPLASVQELLTLVDRATTVVGRHKAPRWCISKICVRSWQTYKGLRKRSSPSSISVGTGPSQIAPSSRNYSGRVRLNHDAASSRTSGSWLPAVLMTFTLS